MELVFFDDEQVISLLCTQVDVFSNIVLSVLVRYTETPNQTLHGNKDLNNSKLDLNTETCTELTAGQWKSRGIFSKDSIRCSSVKKSMCYCWRSSVFYMLL